IINHEYFFSKSHSQPYQLGKIGKYRNLENYIKDYSAPTVLEEVQDWFDSLIKIIPTFSQYIS
ncbi:14108_t:CDS:1, partial [Dentiscutata erythropus]